VNYDDMGAAPAALAGGLLLAALLSLAFALFASVRRQRRELAYLKALGFTRHQVLATLTWQATVTVVMGAVIGVPAGVVAGRTLWVVFAHQLHVEPHVPLGAIRPRGRGLGPGRRARRRHPGSRRRSCPHFGLVASRIALRHVAPGR